ncbi:glycosyltransferase family 39 protein [Paenibacillus sp. J22TS3]|uniref:ArnT family glycosyltransferase n=1 Tax=Paenibacillus sp. J22TS3 TaxID=2807192 RepID=UPI001B1F2784|nr:glycosyltransferase family 39 protein [Paenibacillus sp. J22TS3]GIP23724.1 hypothetical protein J22TS3_39990 [Paenibacillus sp. J22TS3]
MGNKRDRFLMWTCLIVFVLSLLVMIIHGNSLLLGSLNKLDNDDVRYIRSGRYLLETGHLIYYNPVTTPSAFIMPGLPLLLAGVMSIFGTGEAGIYAFRVLQALMTVATVAVLYSCSLKLFNRQAARIAAVAAAAYVPLYYAGNLVLTETAFTLTSVLILYCFIVALDKGRIRDYILLGLSIAAAIYFRPTAALLPLAIGAVWLLKKYKFKTMLKHTVVLSLTIGVCLAPWWIRNYQVFHQFIPLTNSSANPLLLGMLINGNEPADFIRDHPQIYNTYRHGSEQQQKELAWMIFRYQLTHHPFIYGAWLLFGKLIRLIILPFYWAPVMGVPFWLTGLQHLGYLALAIVGLWRMFKLSAQRFISLFAVTAYFIIIYLPFITMERYFYPTMLLMMIPLAYAVQSMIENRQNKQKGRAGSSSYDVNLGA